MISVIIPVYNNYKELKNCLKSLARQSFKDFEVIVVDDGSTCEISKPKVQMLNLFFYKIKHGGAPRARNYGFEKSKGEFVLFCDADMELRDDCLEKMYRALKNSPHKSYAYSDFKYGFKNFIFWEFDKKKLMQNNYVSVCSLLRREYFPGFDESLKRFQDWDLWLTVLGKGGRGIYIPEVLIRVATSSGRISSWMPKLLYKLPFLKRVRDYNMAKEIVIKKHNLNF